MQFKKVEKKCEGKFITRYDITYETVDHQKKVYEMISRILEDYLKLYVDREFKTLPFLPDT